MVCIYCLPFFNRQMLDSAVRAHCKHMSSIQSAVSKIGPWEPGKDQTPPLPSPELSLDKGNYHLYNYGVYLHIHNSIK